MSSRKRVIWDERNLEDNEEYRRLHPVTMHITEPKTPYAYAEFDEEGNFDDVSNNNNNMNNNNNGEDSGNSSTWDPQVNALVRKVKDELAKEVINNAPTAPVTSSGRPMLSLEVTSGEILEQRHAEEFRTMRRAVYADEGAKFKALLAKKHQEEEEEDDDEEDNSEKKSKKG